MRWQDELVSAEDLDYPQGDRARSSRAFGVRTVRRMEKKLVGLGERVDRLDNARMHALRVQLKRLRYVTEFFALFFRQKDMLPYLRCVSALQDILGELNDFVTVRRLLSEFEEPENDIAVSSVRRWMTERERSLRRKLPRAWRILVRARLCH